MPTIEMLQVWKLPGSTTPKEHMSLNSMIPVPAQSLSVGKALPRSVYSVNGDLLLAQGFVIESTEQMATLMNAGYFRQSEFGGRTEPAKPGAADIAHALPSQSTAQEQGIEQKVFMDDVRWQVGETFFSINKGYRRGTPHDLSDI